MMARPARFAISGLVFILDRVSKHWVETHLSVWDTVVVIPGVFNLVHTQNRGAAFGLLNDADGAWRTVVLAGIAVLITALVGIQLYRLPTPSWPGRNATLIGLALVLGGAAGNLFDRIRNGSVTDFLQFFIGPLEWPSFNVADTAISTGAGLLILEIWRTRHPQAG